MLMHSGDISTTSIATFNYEAHSSYILEVIASDAGFENVNNLTINIADVNEKPFFTASTKLGEILEDETIPRVVLNMNASDPDNDVLTYNILTTEPFGAPFTIDNFNGNNSVLSFSEGCAFCHNFFYFSLYSLNIFINNGKL